MGLVQGGSVTRRQGDPVFFVVYFRTSYRIVYCAELQDILCFFSKVNLSYFNKFNKLYFVLIPAFLFVQSFD